MARGSYHRNVASRSTKNSCPLSSPSLYVLWDAWTYRVCVCGLVRDRALAVPVMDILTFSIVCVRCGMVHECSEGRDFAASSVADTAAAAASDSDLPPAAPTLPTLASQPSSRVRFGVDGAASASSGVMSMDLHSGMVQSRDEPSNTSPVC